LKNVDDDDMKSNQSVVSIEKNHEKGMYVFFGNLFWFLYHSVPIEVEKNTWVSMRKTLPE